MEQGGPSLVERVLISQLVLVIVVGVDVNVLPIHLVPVEGGIPVWLEAAGQYTAPPKHTAHLGFWRSETRVVVGGILFINFISVSINNTTMVITVYKLLIL